MDVKNPRRILAVSSADSVQHLSRVMKDLTGATPEQTSTTLAGASHSLSLKTPYYTAEVPIWLDLISSPVEWSASFLSPEAKEVLEVLGGIIIVFALPVRADSDEGKSALDLVQQVGKVVKEGLGGWEWDGVRLCLGVGEIDDVDAWEDCCAESGLEFVQIRNQSTPSRNEFGEKTGIPRALEALEANDWENVSAEDLGSDFEDIDAEIEAQKTHLDEDGMTEEPGATHLDAEDLNFGYDPKDFEGLKRAIWSAGKEDGEDSTDGTPGAATAAEGDRQALGGADSPLDDEDIQKIERMMVKLQAVRDTNTGLPEDQRKRAAAKAVAEVMREI
ncbi:putative alpha and gamma adaptin binding protein p34 [Rosellinia necatrix]|uniref:Putative alpha and gamma adaptin binding protein p34 n=1 Tax=Rosellinia necatrix TaxID=77044 RepID=A0A1W2TWM7_ROSNE|nr:putative alpha and gamma adaptin binding protein p34 [Rosellinia necatrix]